MVCNATHFGGQRCMHRTSWSRWSNRTHACDRHTVILDMNMGSMGFWTFLSMICTRLNIIFIFIFIIIIIIIIVIVIVIVIIVIVIIVIFFIIMTTASSRAKRGRTKLYRSKQQVAKRESIGKHCKNKNKTKKKGEGTHFQETRHQKHENTQAKPNQPKNQTKHICHENQSHRWLDKIKRPQPNKKCVFSSGAKPWAIHASHSTLVNWTKSLIPHNWSLLPVVGECT